MAIIEFFNNPPKTLKALKNSLDYTLNEIKTDIHLIGSHNCNVINPYEDFKFTKQLYNKLNGRQSIQFTQSFDKNENITHEEAFAIAQELVQFERFKDFQIAFAVHTDKDHVHTHFIINTVNLETGSKWQQSKKQLEELKQFSDEICSKHGLSIIERDVKKTPHLTRGEIENNKKGTSWKNEMKLAIEQCKNIAISKDDFKSKLNDFGYDFTWVDSRKYITFFSLENDKHKIRNNKLVPESDYTKENLLNRFELNSQVFKNGQGDIIHNEILEDIEKVKNENVSDKTFDYPLTNIEKNKNNETIEKVDKEKAIKYELFLAVNICKNKSFSKEDFMSNMKKIGYDVQWKDNNKSFSISNDNISLKNTQLYPKDKFTKEALEEQLFINSEKLHKETVERYFENLVEDMSLDEFEKLPLTKLKSERVNSYNKEWKDDLVNCIDTSVIKSTSKDEFIKLMFDNGYEVIWNEDRNIITYTEIETSKSIRNIKIFPKQKYTIKSLLETFEYNKYYNSLESDSKTYKPIKNYDEVNKAIYIASEYSFDEIDFSNKMNKLGYDVQFNANNYIVTNKTNDTVFNSTSISKDNYLHHDKLTRKIDLNIFKDEKEVNKNFEAFMRNLEQLKKDYKDSFFENKNLSALAEEKKVLFNKDFAKVFYTDLNRAIFKSNDKDEFIKIMESKNYKIDWDSEKEQIIFKEKSMNYIIRDIYLYPQEKYSMSGILNTFKYKELERKLVKDLDDTLIFARGITEFKSSIKEKGFETVVNEIDKSITFIDKLSKIEISSKDLFPKNKYSLDNITERFEYNQYYFNVGKNKNSDVKEISFNYRPTTKYQETIKAINIASEHSFDEDEFISNLDKLGYKFEFFDEYYTVKNKINGFYFTSENIKENNHLHKDKIIRRIDMNILFKDEKKQINEKFEDLVNDCNEIKEVYKNSFFDDKLLGALSEEKSILFNKELITKLKKSIDESISISFNKDEFIEKMIEKGFDVKFSNQGFIIFEDKATGYKVRNTKLFPQNKYSIEALKETIEYNQFFYKIERSEAEYKVPTREKEVFRAMIEASKYSISRDDFRQKLDELGYEVQWHENYYDVVSKNSDFSFSTKYISLDSDLYIENLDKQLMYNELFQNDEMQIEFDNIIKNIEEIKSINSNTLFKDKPLLAMSEEKKLLFNESFSKHFYQEINKAMYQSVNKDSFIKNLNEMGYEANWNTDENFIVFTHKETGYKIRNTIMFPDERYTNESLEKMFELNRIDNISSIFNLLSKFEKSQNYSKDSYNKMFGRDELKGDSLKDRIAEQEKGQGLDWSEER